MPPLTRSVCLLLTVTALIGVPAPPLLGQQKALTLSDLYEPSRSTAFGGRPIAGLIWRDDSHYVWPRPAAAGVDWLQVDAVTGRTQPLYEQDRMEASLARLPSISRDEARRLSRSRALIFNPTWTGAMFSTSSDLYYYGFATNSAIRLTTQAGDEEVPTFSPNGTLVAFVRAGNLFVVDVGTAREHAVTSDGGSDILNGRLDWVYEEELYGRGRPRGYWWSPDSTALTFLQLNEKSVPHYTVIDDLPYHPDVKSWAYPKAGDPNPTVKLGVVSVSGNIVNWVDTSKYAGADFLIVNVGWKPDGRAVFYQVQNREQTWLDLNVTDRSTGESRTVLREVSRTWVNCGNFGCQDDEGNPIWLGDGTFLWPSERTGWRHLYLYKEDGTLVRSVTSGKWEVRVLHGIDQPREWVYFSGTERSAIGLDIYRVKLDGSALQRLSTAEGTHSATFSPAWTFYIDRWSDVRTPPQTRLHQADGHETRVLDENRVAALGEYRLSKPEFLQVRTRDGFLMEAMMIRPPDFDPGRKYPVYQFVYGGPHAQTVLNRWSPENMFHQLLAQQGVIVWECDNRTASGKGAESAWPVYRRFGESELRDVEDGIAWLKRQPYVDANRIGIHGWSFGGFLTTYALTHSNSFAMGIAAGTVSDWRDYDTIYTERFLQTPQNNPTGYVDSSPRFAADNLHGRLLLIHGTMDDNVHMQNTLQLAYELQRSGKLFDLMLYPRSRHGLTDPQLNYHLRSTMVRFILDNLRPAAATPRPPASR